MDMLVDTVRDEIAECSEKAYPSIAAAELQNLLMLTSDAALAEFVEQVRAVEWCVRDGAPPALDTYTRTALSDRSADGVLRAIW